jgi:PAS domain S-box-containing protein
MIVREKDDWHLTEELHNELGRGDPFAAAVRATRMAMVITDPRKPDNPIVFCNEAFQRLTGYSRPEIVGHNCRFLQGPETSAADVAKVRAAIDAGESVEVDLLNYRKDGSTFWNALFISPVRGDDGEIKYFFSSQLDVTARVEAVAEVERQKAVVDHEVKRRTAELEAALDAQTLLLHEVDHRVKNNLTMIGSLLRLQLRQIGDAALASKLEDMLERIDALATVHRKLYQSSDVRRFDIAAFAETLAADVIGSSGRTDIALETRMEPIEIASEQASALGLVINEILTNAIKHGFPEGRPGTLRLTANQVDGHASIAIEDDGVGIVHDRLTGGLGRTLITRLSKQAGADVSWTRLERGTRVVVSRLGASEASRAAG